MDFLIAMLLIVVIFMCCLVGAISISILILDKLGVFSE